MIKFFKTKGRDMSKMKWIRYAPIGLLILGSLTLTTIYTHWELSILTGVFLAILSKGMRRARSYKINQRFPDVEG
jgi:hypothetical protein